MPFTAAQRAKATRLKQKKKLTEPEEAWLRRYRAQKNVSKAKERAAREAAQRAEQLAAEGAPAEAAAKQAVDETQGPVADAKQAAQEAEGAAGGAAGGARKGPKPINTTEKQATVDAAARKAEEERLKEQAAKRGAEVLWIASHVVFYPTELAFAKLKADGIDLRPSEDVMEKLWRPAVVACVSDLYPTEPVNVPEWLKWSIALSLPVTALGGLMYSWWRKRQEGAGENAQGAPAPGQLVYCAHCKGQLAPNAPDTAICGTCRVVAHRACTACPKAQAPDPAPPAPAPAPPNGENARAMAPIRKDSIY